jgi:hypothetical protein
MLRLAQKSIWLPIGYHLAWNLIQTAVLGPPTGLPSLLPMEVDGPELWVGRPGHPVPGLLMMAVHIGVAALAGWVRWRRGTTEVTACPDDLTLTA